MKKIMAEIWKDVLKLEQEPETTDSFFDIGGNSFFATQVFQDFEEKTGVKIEVATIYEHETIDSLIDFVESEGNRNE